jgi:hypothetical protein
MLGVIVYVWKGDLWGVVDHSGIVRGHIASYPSSVESECVEFSISVSGNLQYLWSINERRSVGFSIFDVRFGQLYV